MGDEAAGIWTQPSAISNSRPMETQRPHNFLRRCFNPCRITSHLLACWEASLEDLGASVVESPLFNNFTL